MKEVHQDVELEPPLQPLSGETFRHLTANTEPDARADVFETSGPIAAMHSSTRGYSTHKHEATNPEVYHLCTKDLSLRRNESTVKELTRLSMGHSHPWYSRHAVGWATRLRLSSGSWLLPWHRSDAKFTPA